MLFQANKIRSNRIARFVTGLIAAALPVTVLSSTASALVPNLTLTSGNTVVTVNPTVGVTSWTVNGVQQINLQEFFYRLGATGGQSALSSGATIVPTVNSPSSDTITYTTANFTATVNYILAAGNGSTSPSTLNTNVSLTNTTGGTQALHLFDYTDFNLSGQLSPQSVTITGSPANTANQSNSSFTVSSDTVGQGAAGAPSKVQASIGSGLLSSISSTTTPETLNNTLTAGGGDANFAFEYDASLGATGSGPLTFQVGVPSTIQAVPEPASLGLVCLGGLLLGRRRRTAK